MKTKYLQAMGVLTWRLRQADQIQSDACFYHLFNSVNQLVGILITSLPATEFEKQLLSSLLQALNLQAKSGVYQQEAPQYIFLGDSMRRLQVKNSAAIMTHSLSEMLNKPLLKSELWQILYKKFNSN